MTHAASITTTPGTLRKTLVINNTQNHDTITVDLEITIDCNCASKPGSYTNTTYSSR